MTQKWFDQTVFRIDSTQLRTATTTTNTNNTKFVNYVSFGKKKINVHELKTEGQRHGE